MDVIDEAQCRPGMPNIFKKIYVSNVSFLTILIFTPKKFPNGIKIWDTGRQRPLVGLVVVVVVVINAVAQLVSVIVVVSSSFFPDKSMNSACLFGMSVL